MKKITRNKTVFKEYFRDPNIVWIYCNENFKKEATKYKELEEYWLEVSKVLEQTDKYRYIKNVFEREIEPFEYPEGIIDGLEFNIYSNSHFEQKYPHLKSFDFTFDFSQYSTKWPEMILKTKQLMEHEDNWILFEGCFEYKGYKMRPDVLIKQNGKYTLIEVKGCSYPKLEHAYDIIYQLEILRKLNYFVSQDWQAYIATLNKYYVHDEKNTFSETALGILKSDWKVFFNSSPFTLSNFKDIDFDKRFSLMRENFEKKFSKAIEVGNTIIEFYNNWLLNNDFDQVISKIDEIQNLDENPINNSYEINVDWKAFGGSMFLPYLLLKAGVEIEGAKISYDETEDDELSDSGSSIESGNEISVSTRFKKNSIFSLSGDVTWSFKKKALLFNDGKKLITDIEPYELVPKTIVDELKSYDALECLKQHGNKCKRLIQQQLLGKQEQIISKDKLEIELEMYRMFPIYMFDFETFKTAVPRINGTQTYNQIPFQYSIHVIKESGEVEHLEWLATSKENIYEEFWKAFTIDIQKYGPGTWVSYNKSFERMVIRNFLENKYFNHLSFEKQTMKKIWEEVIDLMVPFKNFMYYDPSFRGSYSIKVVAPHFASNLDYSKLQKIQKGDKASLYAKLWIMNGSPLYKDLFKEYDYSYFENEWKSIRPNMLQYCNYDTLSMVEIYKGLMLLFKKN